MAGNAGHLGSLTGHDKRRVPGLATAVSRAAPMLLCGVLMATCSAATGAKRSPSIVPRRPSGPTARMAPLSGGNGVFLAEPIAVNLKRFGYAQHEYTASGTARSYRPNGQLRFDGRWSFVPDGHASYRTRVLVRYPSDPARFSGRVVIEWLNVSGGVDADPEWASLSQEILRQGDAWVGVSAQQIGVMGGPVLVKVPGPGTQVVGKGLRGIDPKRYGSLHVPGDGFSFDIFTQVARVYPRRRRHGGAPAAAADRRRRIAVGVCTCDLLRRRAATLARV